MQGQLPWELWMFTAMFANAGSAPLGALDAYNYVCKMQGQLPFELCWFTARFAKRRGSSPELWMFIAMLAKCRGSSPWSLGSLQLCLQNAGAAPLGALDVYSYVCKMQGHFPLELCIFTARLAKCRGSSPSERGLFAAEMGSATEDLLSSLLVRICLLAP